MLVQTDHKNNSAAQSIQATQANIDSIVK